jgi:hypothetical protein
MRGERARKRRSKTLPLITLMKRIFTEKKNDWQEQQDIFGVPI